MGPEPMTLRLKVWCSTDWANRAAHTVAWPSGLRRWFKAPVSSEAWVRIPPLPRASFYKVNDSPILSSQIEFFFVFFFTFLFLLSLVFHQKKKTYKQWEEKAKVNRDTREKTPTQRQRKNVANVWNPLLHGTSWHLNILFWKWLKYLKRCLQILPASLFSEKECTLLSIELFFGKKVLKASSGFCWNLSVVFDLPNGKSYLKSNFSNDCLNTAS